MVILGENSLPDEEESVFALMFRSFSPLSCLEPCKNVRLLMGGASSRSYKEVAMCLQVVPLAVLQSRTLSLCGLVLSVSVMEGCAIAGVVGIGVVEIVG